MKKTAKTSRFPEADTNAGKLALVVLVTGVVWVCITDGLLELIVDTESAGYRQWQTYKAWIFCVLLASGVFFISRRFLQKLYGAQRALAQSEKNLRVTLDSIPSTFAIYDSELRFRYVNARGRFLGGHTLDEMIGKRDDELLPLATTCNYVSLLKQARETGITKSAECEVQVPHGGPLLTAVVTYVPIKDDHGNIEQILGVTHDITERKKAEKELRVREEQFRQLADNLPGVMYACHNDSVYTPIYVSNTVESHLGLTPEEMMSGKITFKDLVHPDDFAIVQQVVNAALELREPYHIIYRAILPDGRVRWMDERGVGIYREGRLENLQGFFLDVTADKQLEQEQSVLARLVQALAAADTVESLGQAVLAGVELVWGLDAFFFSMRQSGNGIFRTILTMDTTNGERMYGDSIRYSSTLSETLRRGEPMLVLRGEDADTEGWERFGDETRASMSLMFVPVKAHGRTLGVLSVQSYEINKYSKRDLELFQQIAAAVAPALERCRAEERSRAFSQLGEQLGAVVTSKEAAEIIVTVADQLVGWDACGLYLSSMDSELVHRLTAYDIVNGERTLLEEIDRPIDKYGLILRTYQEGQLLILRGDPASEPNLRPFGNTNRLSASLIWVAMRGRAGIIGALTIQSYTLDAYDDEDVQLIQALANYCSMSLERTRAEQDLKLREERYRFAISNAGAVPYQLNYSDMEYVFVGEGIEQLTGWPVEKFSASLWRSLVQEVVPRGISEQRHYKEIADDVRRGRLKSWQADLRIITRSGETRWIADTSIEIFDKSRRVRGSLGILIDITDRKETERKLLHSALHDPLTGLANRALLLDHLQQALHRSSRRDGGQVAVLFIDLDRFKTVNDSLGHMMGDKLLMAVARRLKECVRPGDTVARFAGDEFVLLLDDVRHRDDVVPVAERVLQKIAAPHLLDGQEVSISASIGIAFGSLTYNQPEELLRDADNALYIAKSRGKNRYDFFDSTMHEHAVTTLEIENDLRRALAREELEVHYQPIVDLATGRISHFEALLRWNHPQRGSIPPDQFIKVAEESGLIISIGYWVFDQAAAQLAEWHAKFPQDPPLQMSVNLSARQFAVPNLDEKLVETVKRWGLTPAGFQLELTESTLLEKRDAVSGLLNRLKEAGFGLSLDDFGTGYSSLSYLHQYPIDVVKIDRSFVGRMQASGPEREIIRSIVQLAHSLKLGATAEGVETVEQAEMLQEMKCGYLQGWVFSKALPPEEASALLARDARLNISSSRPLESGGGGGDS